jgi:hypothetical protein
MSPGRGVWKRADRNPSAPLPTRGIRSTPFPTTLARKPAEVSLRRQAALMGQRTFRL